jgi:uncharacterized small protein (DUF1192 family)
MYSLAGEMKLLERELAAAKAECERLTANQRQPAEDIFVSHLCDEITRLRAELASKAACYDIACGEVQRLRADLERFTGHGLLDCHAICDQRDAATAERDRLRAEVERLKGALALGQQNCDDLREERDEAIARAEKAEAALAFIAQNGGTKHETECGTISCNGSWCAEQARAAIDSAMKGTP